MNTSLKLGIFIFSLLIFSCRKEYTCECQETSTINGYTTYSNPKFNTLAKKREDAEATCIGNNLNETGFNYSVYRTCELK
ncbi:MAG: hypothetical protein ABF265_10520 [Polaribacter sp.]